MKRNLIILLMLSFICSVFAQATLGVVLKEANSPEIEKEKRHDYGVYIESLVKSGRAEKAGFLKGDIVIAFDDEKVYTMSQLKTMLDIRKPGDKAKFEVLRDGKKKKIKLELGSRDELNPSPAYLGVYGDKLTERRRKKIGLTLPYGVQVDVVRDGPAYKGGLRTGDVILELEGHKAYTFDQLRKIVSDLRKGQEIKILVHRDGKKTFKAVLGSRASNNEIIHVGDVSVSVPELNIDSGLIKDFIPFYSGTTVTSDKYIGANIKVVSVQKNDDEPDTFVEIVGILADTPAFDSDLKPGDRLITVDGKKVEDYYDLQKIIQNTDKEIEFEYKRKSKKRKTGIKPIMYKDRLSFKWFRGGSASLNFNSMKHYKNYIQKDEKVERTMFNDDKAYIYTDKNLYRIQTEMEGKII